MEEDEEIKPGLKLVLRLAGGASSVMVSDIEKQPDGLYMGIGITSNGGIPFNAVYWSSYHVWYEWEEPKNHAKSRTMEEIRQEYILMEKTLNDR